MDNNLEIVKLQILKKVKEQYNIVTLKDHPIFGAYRDFYWKIRIDPTKNRPAAEALTRRILAGKELPCINTLVDAYNLASISSGIALATFDSDILKGDLLMRFAEKGEQILGIGMKKPFFLKGEEIVISDKKKLIAIYPYRDSDDTKVTLETKNVTIVICGVPGIKKETLKSASDVAKDYILRFCS
ncbi:hypothetical protein KJN74_02930 [Candidatus Bathyarchaeota archaeon]|nr:hypothetical protein [Candidatus Bathyarchaeota archaeon]